MRKKKRYIVMREYPRSLPEGAEFLFQDERGYVFRASISAAEPLRKQASFISGSMKKVKNRPKVLNRRTNHRTNGMK